MAVIDTGVDALRRRFRGRVAAGGERLHVGGNGDTDAAISAPSPRRSPTPAPAPRHRRGAATAQPAAAPSTDGHGTPVAGVVAQFVPQATIVPVDIFAFLVPSTTTTTTTTTTATGTTGGVAVPAAANSTRYARTTFYEGLNYVAQHPFVNDPVRPGQVDRVIADGDGVRLDHRPYNAETEAYKQFPQILSRSKTR